jgi:pSer/pThr/pTyr-binding forkhead associated (FHA) protein
VPFTLTVASGPGKKPAFDFNGGEARLGRTSDNDIVVKDGNASRSHARVFEKDGRHFVEDLKSANGTLHNGEVLQGTSAELKDGDTISIGEIEFTFTVLLTPSFEFPKEEFDLSDTVVRGGTGVNIEIPKTDSSATLLKPALDPKKLRPFKETERSAPVKAEPAVNPAFAATDELEPEPKPAPPTLPPPLPSAGPGPSTTDETDGVGSIAQVMRMTPEGALEPKSKENALPAKAKPSAPAPKVVDVPASTPDTTLEVDEPPAPLRVRRGGSGLAKKEEEDSQLHEVTDEKANVRRGGGLKRSDDKEAQLSTGKSPTVDSLLGENGEMTAAERARLRRAANRTTAGRLLYAWGQLGVLPRVAFTSAAGIFIVGLASFAYAQLVPPAKAPPPPEPNELVAGAATIEQSFGAGDGVTYERPDMKLFNFKAVAATRLVGLLHYQARDISKEEVSIAVNGFDLGFVPPDGLDSADRELEVVLPAPQVKRGEENQIIFDNVRNPPAKDPWRVWNLWLELLALPDTNSEETLIQVKDDLARAQKFYEQRDIGPDALFKAWKQYRDAWLKLESLPGRPNDLYVVARSQQQETRLLMDKRCKTMQIDVQRALQSRVPNYALARKVLNDMLRYFPTREHPCYGLIQAQLEQIEAN